MRHTMFEDISPSDLESTIEQWVRGRRAHRNRQILKDRMLLGITFEELAERHELSVRQVKNIVYRYESIICSKLKV